MKLQSKKIIIAEDDILLSIGIESIVEKLGNQIRHKCTSGKELIEKALELEPDLIIVDILLKDPISGIDAVEKIQKKIPELSVIYITADSDPDLKENARQKTEFIDYLLKPVELKKLKEAIRNS